jgi:hypothetical protein
MMWLPNAADAAEKETSAGQLATTVIQLAAVGDGTITAVSISPEN